MKATQMLALAGALAAFDYEPTRYYERKLPRNHFEKRKRKRKLQKAARKAQRRAK